jgi:hypothetical protein
LDIKRKEQRGRACIYDSTLNNPLLDHYIRCAVHLCTIDAALNGAGYLTTTVLTEERNKIKHIEDCVNPILSIQGEVKVRDLLPEETDEIRILEADILESWDKTASLDYIRDFNRQVPPDELFETLIEDVRKAALKLQSKDNSSENAKFKGWTKLLIRLKGAQA